MKLASKWWLFLAGCIAIRCLLPIRWSYFSEYVISRVSYKLIQPVIHLWNSPGHQLYIIAIFQSEDYFTSRCNLFLPHLFQHARQDSLGMSLFSTLFARNRHWMTNEAVISTDGTDFSCEDRNGRPFGSFGIRASHLDALSRDLSLSRVPRGHYEERSRQPVWISERPGVIPSAGCSNWPLITDARLVSALPRRGRGSQQRRN